MAIYCTKFHGRVMNYSADKATMHRLRCKQWSCDYCYAINAKIWRAKLFKSAVEMLKNGTFSDFCFITVTLPSRLHNKGFLASYEKIEEGADFIRANWDKFMKRLKRQYGKFQYVRVLETHKTGVLHIHLLATFKISDSKPVKRADGSIFNQSKTIVRHARSCGFGWIHDATNLEKLGGNELESVIAIVSYVTKYLTKSNPYLDSVFSKKMIRKVQTSRGFLIGVTKSFESDLNWNFVNSKLTKGEYFDLRLQGYKVVDTQRGELSTKDFIKGFFNDTTDSD
jgi:hypothetical protein